MMASLTWTHTQFISPWHNGTYSVYLIWTKDPNSVLTNKEIYSVLSYHISSPIPRLILIPKYLVLSITANIFSPIGPGYYINNHFLHRQMFSHNLPGHIFSPIFCLPIGGFSVLSGLHCQV